jgi:polyhydroxyalkanoate synthesis regulator phasin
MAEPENQTLRILRDLRTGLQRLEQKVDQNQDDLRSRLDNIRQAMIGESVLGRYAAAEVDERLDSLEKRVKALEGRR